jgi:AGZA family xanthine/uracil permease-like MFS transporter
MMVAGLFVLALFFSPLATSIPAFATAPALIVVGGLMMQSVAHIQWPDFSEAFPAFVTAVAMPLTFSIATGLSFGVITYSAVKLAAGKRREVSVVMWVLTIVFVLRDVYLAGG